MASNFKDNYIRQNPRDYVKCEPSLYQDKYIFKKKQIVETFVANEDLDDYYYLGENNNKTICDKGLIKYGDEYISNEIDNLYNKKQGQIKEIDSIHNAKIVKRINYNQMNLININNVRERLRKNVNNSVLSMNSRINYLHH